MIDNRKHIPTDALMVKHPCGDPAILLFTWDKVNGRRMAGDSNFKPGDEVSGAIVRDFVGKEPKEPSTFPEMYNPAIAELAKKNYLQNKGGACALPWMRKTVVLCGAGPSLERDIPLLEKNRERLTIVTMGKAQRHIQGDYYIGLDPFPDHMSNLEGAETRNTAALLAVTVFPGIAELPWKEVGYFTHLIHDRHENIPVLAAGEHVGFDALQFAVNHLRAKKVLLVGMEHWCDKIIGYYYHGKQMEAGSYWISKHDIEVWNCTREGSVLNGVIHGKLSEVLNG